MYKIAALTDQDIKRISSDFENQIQLIREFLYNYNECSIPVDWVVDTGNSNYLIEIPQIVGSFTSPYRNFILYWQNQIFPLKTEWTITYKILVNLTSHKINDELAEEIHKAFLPLETSIVLGGAIQKFTTEIIEELEE